MSEAKDVMAKDASKVIDLPEDVELIATAVVTKDNNEITIVLTECPSEAGNVYETMIHSENINKDDGDTWITVGKVFKAHKDANAMFVESLESYKKLGYIFPRMTE